MSHRPLITAAAALVLLTFVRLARTDPAKSAADLHPNDSPVAAPHVPRSAVPPPDARGYTYQFTDDPLAAGGFDAHDARIVVASHVIRTTLIRPRTAFVVEMLKTVENL